MPNYFATHFSPADLGILDIVSDLSSARLAIRLELFKLDIYGK
jgi:hypothetical protein